MASVTINAASQTVVITALSGSVPTGSTVPTGGLANQVLGKSSGTDYDMAWITPSGSGDMLASANLSDVADAATSRTNLGVDAAGTDNSTNVTVAAGRDYITLSGQELTLGPVDLAADITGNLPMTSLNGGAGASSSTFLRGDGTWVSPAGSGDLLAANNLSDLNNAETARTNLGLAIGSNVQAFQAAQAQSVWETGTATTESVVSPAKIAAAVSALASGGGDMIKATYDPNTVNGNVFDMANMVEATTEKIFTATERTKLSGIATAATANDTDANLLSRANHTGTQVASTVSDFSTAADARITNAVGTSVQAFDADTAKTDVAQVFTKSQGVTPVGLTDGATIATDASLSNIFTVTLAGNRTLSNPTNLVAGKTYIWQATQDATGTRTLAYGSYFKFPGGTAPTLTTAANSIDIIIGLATSSTELICNSVLDFQ